MHRRRRRREPPDHGIRRAPRPLHQRPNAQQPQQPRQVDQIGAHRGDGQWNKHFNNGGPTNGEDKQSERVAKAVLHQGGAASHRLETAGALQRGLMNSLIFS